ncbi:MAG: phenylalanine--tRNA ligase subunit beta [Filifactoraceae bacterium]
MRVPLKWLRDYVDIDVSASEFADMMTLTGTKAETVEELGKEINNVVVGRIERIDKHPDADKLVVCLVNVGIEKIQIVTGATNIAEGDLIPVALDESTLPGGIKIKKGKLRGVDSCGMLCSHQELGIDEKMIPENMRNGIYILDGDYELGKDIKEVLSINDAIIEFEITANRPDCLSMMGVAYEAGATLGQKIKFRDSVLEESDIDIKHKAEVLDKDLCFRYMLREVVDVKVGESPYYIKQRLIEAGLRPINNIVDITNYVMLEYGQPLHAFDKLDLETDNIVVRRAIEGEKFITLDEQERVLDKSMLMITDGKKSVCIAGIMGGLNSGVKSSTNNIILESATFSPESIRSTSRKLGLRTDSSSRFEKGIDLKRAEQALEKACEMIESLGIGKILKGKIDIRETEILNKNFNVYGDRVRLLIGEDISNDRIIEILESLEFKVDSDGDKLNITVPSFRLDISMTDDIVEEVARIYGYNNIISKAINSQVIPGLKSSKRRFEDKVKYAAMSNGLTEITTYSFVSPSGVEKSRLNLDYYGNFLKLLNPLGEETSVMRTSLIPNMLDVVLTNVSRKNEEFYAFELGNTFFNGNADFPEEISGFVAASYGKNEDFFSLKARVEGVLNKLGVKNAFYKPCKDNDTFHPGKTAKIIVRGNLELGIIGELHPIVLENYNIKKKVYLCEINLPLLMEVSNDNIKYKQVPKYPAITRDIALLVGENQYIGEIEDIIRKKGEKLIESIELFDVYKGNQIDEDKKSVAYSIKYRSADRSLTDEEVNEIQKQIISEFEKIGIKQR